MATRIERIGDATLYLGDCREVLPSINPVEAVVTHPPYGIGFVYATYDDSSAKWFPLMNDVVPLCRKAAQFVVMPVCAIARLDWWYTTHRPDWLIAWYKGSPGHRSAIGFNDWEPHVVWGRPNKAMHDYFATACGFDDNGHPCPKPLEYAMWLSARAADFGETIADPFMGSGTTGVAAMKLGRNFIGIEIDATYFEIACGRIEEAVRQADLFIQRSIYVAPKQLKLFE